MRKYQAIWEQIKKKRICKVEANSRLHKRIKKAVIKEKDQDITFKVEFEENKFRLVISAEKDVLTFQLKTDIGIGDL